MASGKTSLRQKMINLMYLVFISIVAISVSENVLLSYKDTERSLGHSKKLSEEKNKNLYQTLKVKSDNDVDKFGDLNRNALEIQKKSTQTVESIEQMKSKMLKLGKIESLENDVQYSLLENPKVPHDYFFKGGIFSSKKTPSEQGDKLIKGISVLREYLLHFINSGEYKSRFLDLDKSIAKSLNTESLKGRDGKKTSWLEGKFGDVPLNFCHNHIESDTSRNSHFRVRYCFENARRAIVFRNLIFQLFHFIECKKICIFFWGRV